MKEVVAKKYVKAVLSDKNLAQLDEFLANLEQISSAFGSDKFKNIISLPTLSTQKKADFLLSLIQNPSQKFVNFINLLATNKRFELLPTIFNELKSQRAAMQNIYLGKIYGSYDLSSDEVVALEDKFSKRFNAKIKLEVVKQEYNGIKVELNDLGVEVSFSVDRLKAQMSEYILKAI